MAKFPLDLSKFKKIHADDKVTTLRHPGGHEIRLAHNQLSPKMRGELSALPLADGGEVPDVDPKKASEFVKGATSSGIRPKEWLKNLKEGIKPEPKEEPKQQQAQMDSDKPEMLADGGEVAASGQEPDSPDKIIQDAQQQQSPPHQAPVVVNVNGGQQQQQPQSESIAHQVGQGIRQAISDAAGAFGNVAKPVVQGGKELMGGLAGAPAQAAEQQQQPQAPQASVSPSAPAQSSAAQPQGAAGQPAQAASDPYGTQEYSKFYNQGISEQEKGLQEQATAQSQVAQQQSNALTSTIDHLQKQQLSYQDHYSDLEKERQDFQHDIQNSHIDPNHYFNSQDIGGKIATGIGLIMGGLGAGITGGPNPALQYLNSQIDRDIDAQKANIGKSENLLSANMRQFGNLRDATDMTKVMQMSVLEQELKQKAAQAGGAMAKANLDNALGQLHTQSAGIMSQIAMRKTLLGGMKNGQVDAARVINMIVPEGQRKEANDELKAAQTLQKGRENVIAAIDKVAKLNTIGSRAMSPIQSGRQIAAITKPLIAELSKETAGRFTETDASFLESLFPKIGDSEETINTKRAAAVKLLNEKMNFPVLDAYGINMSAKSGGVSFKPLK